ncbi:MAG: hypothetical protein A6F72_01595 [Cycloclasticus sp. symbiont of Poecilosclerida sp. N]|nr:MAG: hypothetical protein A6F72_01595 [Cycloclasticus sp. symbiont of Poecilosclerida sp. N]
MQTQDFKTEVEGLIQQRKEGYRADSNLIPSNYGTEKETVKEYNGRQLLELLQNADDAQSQQVSIKLDTEQKVLTISNNGENCDSFSVEGVKSIMYANLSSKTNNQNQYIGNKGLGFRSIINWADEISILTNGVKICFSQEIIKKYYIDLTKLEQREEIKQKRNLLDDEIPMAVLAIPEIQEFDGKHWTTAINIQYKENFLEDIKNQINTIKEEVLLYLNHLQSIEIDIDGEIKTIKSPVTKWTIKDASGEVPNEYLGENDKNNKYELKIAYNDELTNNGNNCLFAYFPTKIKVDLPFIVHGTFELDSSRNQLTDNPKNKFIIKKLVEFIIETALNLKQDEANYQALIFLQYEHRNEILDGLGFYREIDTAIEESEIYPCLDNEYRKKADIVYNNDFTNFIHNNNFIEHTPYLLKPSYKQELLSELELNEFDRINIEGIKLVNQEIKKNVVRVKFIYHLIKNNYEYNYPLLTDENGKLVGLGDIYAPATEKFSLPNYVDIKIISQELFELMNEHEEPNENWKEFTQLKPHDKLEIFSKVITSTNSELEKGDEKPTDLIKSTISFLYKNYSDSIPISEQKIQLLDKIQKSQSAKNLYLSKTYPSGGLTEELFGDIFEDNDFLADISIYKLGDDKKRIENFFIWLGVNKYAKFVENKTTSSKSVNLIKIERFDEIRKLPIENIITWLLSDERTQNGPKEIPVENEVPLQLKSLFENRLISSNNKVNNLVNDKCVDYDHSLFKSNNFNKADIESLLLKWGAVDKFSELSFPKIEEVLNSLPEKDPQGKLAQKTYLESFKTNKTNSSLTHKITLFAKKGDDLGYFPQDEVYYAGGVKLPKKCTDRLAIFDFPKKRTEAVIGFFDIKDLSRFEPEINKQELSGINDDFQEFFERIKPYVLAYRVGGLENRDGEAEAKKIDKLSIKLCQKICCKIEDEDYELSDYDYLIGDNDYLIKIPNERLGYIKQEYDFYTVFGDIVGLIFGLENTDKFKNCIKDSENNIKRDIKDHIGSDAINEAQDLLGIASDFYNFWHKIYELKKKEYTGNHNNNLELINQELEIDIKNGQIEYGDLTDKKNAEVVIDIFKRLKIKISDFNNGQTNKISLSSYHQQKLEECFSDNNYQFRRNLHKDCIDKSQESEFLTKVNQYKAPVTDCSTKLVVDYEAEYDLFVKKTFGFKLLELNNYLDFHDLYRSRKRGLGADFTYIEDGGKKESLLYFPNNEQALEKEIKNQKEQEQKQIGNQKTKKETPTLEISDAILETPEKRSEKSGVTKHGGNGDQQQKNKQKSGMRSEASVNQFLVKEYGKENVQWVSETNKYANHDFKYKDGNKWWYVEVKTLANDMFYISKNELDFAKKHKDKYKIFLVGDEIKRIHPVNLEDEDQFRIEPKDFSVSYKLKG